MRSCAVLRSHWPGRGHCYGEVDTADGLPGMTIVGLPDAAVQESRERILAAVKNAGLSYPRKRIVVKR
ncbi:MAG: hypothetical protein JW726_18105 [Anaerolineales bacterium]|nr:hypothetical protein [Anaerolineales bacterium]